MQHVGVNLCVFAPHRPPWGTRNGDHWKPLHYAGGENLYFEVTCVQLGTDQKMLKAGPELLL